MTRGHKHKSPYSPKSGYTYAGLFRVESHFQENGKDGFQICRYRLVKIEPDQRPATSSLTITSGEGKTRRVETSVLRIVRDTTLAKEIKDRYKFRCQVCGTKLAVRGVPYAEAAHIRPLGNPHNGQDVEGNIICLCLNHHVLFDRGGFTIDLNHNLIGIDGTLTLIPDHQLDSENLTYHKEHIYTND